MKGVGFLGALAGLVLAGGVGSAQIFTLGFQGINFDCGDSRTGPAGEAVELDVFATLTCEGIAEEPGPRGFSLSIGLENLELVPALQPLPDDPGTPEVDESFIDNPKLLSGYYWDRTVPPSGIALSQAAVMMSGGFESTLPVDPDVEPETGPLAGLGPQGHGLVSGVLISLSGKQTLPISGTTTLLRFKVRGTFPAAGKKTGRILFKDGLVAGGEPVKNLVAYERRSRAANLEECIITLGALEPTFGLKVFAEGVTPVRGPGDSTVETDAPIGEKRRGVALVYLDSMSLEADGPKGWQFGLAMEGLNLVPALQPLPDDPSTPEDESTINNPKVLSGYHWDRTIAPNGLALTRAAEIYSAGFESTLPADPNDPFDGLIYPRPRQPQGVVAAMILTLTGKQTLPGDGIASILRVEFEQRWAFRSETEPIQEARLFFQAGLVAEGEPTGNVITFKGRSHPPAFTSQLHLRFKPVKGIIDPYPMLGDADANGRVNLNDALFIIRYQFGIENSSGDLPPAPPCLDAADPNNDKRIDIADAIFIINALFRPEVGNTLRMVCEVDPDSTEQSCPTESRVCP